MNYGVYFLRLRNGQFYVGSTDDLQRRLGEHLAGHGSRTTALWGPPQLLYSEPHPDHCSALQREHQLKGWSHAKKLALVRGELEHLKQLAQCHMAQRIHSGE